MSNCVYCIDEVCVNAECPVCADYCPVIDTPEICRFEIRPLTNFERIKAMSIDEMATAIYNGISSDPCDYCEHNNHHCTGAPCKEKANTDIIAEWLKSEVQSDELF